MNKNSPLQNNDFVIGTYVTTTAIDEPGMLKPSAWKARRLHILQQLQHIRERNLCDRQSDVSAAARRLFA